MGSQNQGIIMVFSIIVSMTMTGRTFYGNVTRELQEDILGVKKYLAKCYMLDFGVLLCSNTLNKMHKLVMHVRG